MEEKDYNSFGFKNSFIDKYNKSNQNIKNMVNKKISINETFGVDPVVYNEQKKAKQAKQQFFDTLGNKEHMSGALVKNTGFYKNKEQYYPDHNITISDKGNVSIPYNVERRPSRRGLSNETYTMHGMKTRDLDVKPSFKLEGMHQADHFKNNRFSGRTVSDHRTFKNAQKIKDSIVKKKFVRDAMKTIYGNPKNNLINKYGKR